MCLITLAYRVHPDYPLLMAANRDEFFDRPTAPLGQWADCPDLYAGQDLQAGGTWLGVRCARPGHGRLAALTNVRDLPAPEKSGPSRGKLVVDTLTSEWPLAGTLRTLEREADAYQGFNLLAADADGLYYLSNHTRGMERLQPGLYGLSNATLDVPWPKVNSACDAMSRFVKAPGSAVDLAHLLDNPAMAEDSALPATGLPHDWEKALSAEFIHLPEYGTRSCTGVMIDRTGKAVVHEQNYDREGRTADPQTVELPGFWPAL